MKRGTLNLLLSLAFLFIVIGSFYFVWKSASQNAQPVIVSTTYQTVDVSDIKNQADKLIKTRENNAGIPIPTPTEKLGKPNPFNNPEWIL